MSFTDQFKDLLDRVFPIAKDLRIVARWEIPFHEAARIAAEGRLPTAVVELGRDDAWAYTSPWQSFWMTQMWDRDKDIQLIVQMVQGKAAYEILAVERLRGQEEK